mgnify:CR=1 FL=1
MDRDQIKQVADQIKQILVPIMAGLGGWLVGSGKLTEEQWSLAVNLGAQYGPAAIIALLTAYAAWRNRPRGKIEAAAAVPGVQMQVNTSVASPGVAAVATDRDSFKNVTPV